jgi:predicted dehydrogenase
MKELNVGIVGFGWVARAHLQALKAVEGARVVAICDRLPYDAQELEGEFGIPLKVYQDYAEMLRDSSIDAVSICTPHPFHPQLAIAAAEAGKHLIIEKPLALTFDESKAILAAVAKTGVQTCVCFECRYSKHFSLIRSCIDNDLLGDIHYAEVDYYHGIGPWYGQFEWNVKKAMGGSSLLTAGCHALDSLLFFMDGEVEEVTCYGTRSVSETFEPYEYDTSSVTILKFADGSIGKVASIIDCLQPYYFHVHLVGSQGSLLDNKIYSAKLDGLAKDRWSTLETSLIDSGDVVDHPYQPQFQAFVDSIQNKEAMPLTDLTTAFETHRVLFAAELSAAEGRPVKVSELT